MIHKLRKKFILINMSLVFLVLIIVFSSVCFFSYQWNKAETYMVMERVLSSEFGMPPPSLEIREKNPDRSVFMTPVFSVLVSEDGEISSIRKENVTVSDTVIEKLAEQTLSTNKKTGILLDSQLRYLIKKTPEGTKIAFADMGRELDSLQKLILSLVLVGLGGLSAFFFISLFISKWILHPVEKAWQQQRQFVADASHELKTPLTVILANLGILLAHPKDTIESHKKWLDNTNAEAIRMKTLIEDLLFLAKSDAALTEMLAKSNVNISDILWSCILPFEPLAYEKGHLIESEIDSDIMIFGDAGQLQQLIINLLDNACKYAAEKSIIKVQMGIQQENIKLSVNNAGPPIPEEQLELIFERFYCTDSSRSLEKGGYGLGLSIAKTIVDNHSGKISVESNEKSGTTFTVLLPVKS